jgi:hypothetical protein
MKHTLPILSLLLCGSLAFGAGLSQLTLSISTPGPDTYADGQLVQVGETYLLVYVAAGSTFKGVQTDGSLVDPVNNRVVAQSAAVEGAKCGFKAIQYPSNLYPAGGSWVLVLLDTRDASGAVGSLVAAQGAGAVKSAASGDSTSLNALSAGAGAAVLCAAAVSPAPADTPAPVLAAVKPQGSTVDIRIENVTGRALYEVQSTTDLASGDWQAAAGGKRLRATAAQLPVEVQVPAADKVRFFRVVVPGSN